MAPTSKTLAVQADSGSLPSLDHGQTLKAATALLKHMKTSLADKAGKSEKKNLLADADDSNDVNTEGLPIWLQITTKKHIVEEKRLKPAKLSLPHPFKYPAATTICLITSDPQRTFKDIVFATESPIAFPELQGGNVKITRVIGITKLKAKYHRYEAQRQLRDEYDLFLADDRIITRLPQVLGKTFYSSSTKRPIPLRLEANKPRNAEGKRIPSAKGKSGVNPTSATTESTVARARDTRTMHAEIERTLNSALLSLSPSTCTAIRVGFASWPAAHIAENVTSVIEQIVARWVPKKWNGVRAIHVKGTETAALPIWMTNELWIDETMVLEDKAEEMKAIKAAKDAITQARRIKRKADRMVKAEKDLAPDAKKQKTLPAGDDGNLDKEIQLRQEKLKKQKEEAVKDIVEDIAVSSTAAGTSASSSSMHKVKSGGKSKKRKSVGSAA